LYKSKSLNYAFGVSESRRQQKKHVPKTDRKLTMVND